MHDHAEHPVRVGQGSGEPVVVIPNYFEPFERRNVELDFVIYTDVSAFDFRFVKGDCDQDRPNEL